MSQIWKFSLHGPQQEIAMPKGAEILSVQRQDSEPQIWARINPDAPKEIRRFRSIMTGEEFDATGLLYIGTVQIRDGVFVVHVFEERT